MKIILDEQRAFPDGPYNCVRTYEDCVEMIRLCRIDVKHINIHPDHSAGIPKTLEYAWTRLPHTSLTLNPLT